jgi:hypothetical protein
MAAPMTSRVRAEDASAQDRNLAAALEVLASPIRLTLLRQLRSPRALREIEVRVAEEGQQGPARNLARQTVRDHLERLLAIGVVTTRSGERSYGPTTEYLLNHQAVYALSEEFRELARLRPAHEPNVQTVVHPAAAPAPESDGPCLVLVKGLDEGRQFPLPPPAGGRRTWTIGRRRGLEVALDFDPFVSNENAMVVWEGGRHHIEDLEGSRNGTLINFRPLAKGARHPLRTGDVVGIGRSLLMYRA